MISKLHVTSSKVIGLGFLGRLGLGLRYHNGQVLGFRFWRQVCRRIY
jgi:hypothetical protein